MSVSGLNLFNQQVKLNSWGKKMIHQAAKRTPLYNRHTAHGANMLNFGGYDMPLWYPTGAKDEHLVVCTKAGIFDTSHMAVITITGSDAFDLLQLCFTKDLNACIGKSNKPVSPGRCVYGAFLNEKGECLDDAIVYNLADRNYMVVVNAGMGGEITRHLKSYRGQQSVEVIDLTDKIGKIDLQGPMAAKIFMKMLINPEEVLEDMLYFTFKGHFDQLSPLANNVRLTDGTPLLLSRTGYTGEFGFEIFVAPEHIVKVWNLVLDAGKDFGLIPCGLAARDSLRVGAVLPLSHRDIGSWPFINHPWTFALPFNAEGTGFTKNFIGADALKNPGKSEYTYAFVGYDPRKVAVCTQVGVFDSGGNHLGVVLTCVTDMAIGRHNGRIYSVASPDKPKNFTPNGLCCGFVKVTSNFDYGQVLELRDGQRKIKVMIGDDIRPDRTARRLIKEML